jgi:hypothetical protein
MADVSISSLTQGIPAGNNVLPYSTGSSTLGVPVSAIFQNVNNVGIGTNNPTSALDVNGTISSNYLLLNPQNSTGEGGEIGFKGSGGNTDLYIDNHFGNLRVFSSLSPSGALPADKCFLVYGTIKAAALQVPGCVVQVVQAYKTDIWKPTLVNTWEDVTGLSVSITLKSATSKVLINTSVAASRGGDGNDAFVRIVRVTGSTSTAIGGGSNSISNLNNVFGQVAGQYSGTFQSFSLNTMYLDTPVGVTSTYKIQFLNGAAGSAKVNCRALLDDMIVASHITLQEIAQ